MLAFSIIMLQTDLHSDQIKKKMTVDEFVSNNRGINEGKDLPREYLASLYNNILNNPLTLNEDEDAKAKLESANAATTLAKMELFYREVQTMVVRSQKALREHHLSTTKHAEVVRQLEAEAAAADVEGLQVGISLGKDSVGSGKDETPGSGKDSGKDSKDGNAGLISTVTSGLDTSSMAGTTADGLGMSSMAVFQQLQQAMSKKGTYRNAADLDSEVIGVALFEVACWPLLATFSVLLETTQNTNSAGERNNDPFSQDAERTAEQQKKDDQIVELCVEGFKHCIKYAARFNMDTERDAFVCSLSKFTYLATVKSMRQKNIECIKALLYVGLTEGKFVLNWNKNH